MAMAPSSIFLLFTALLSFLQFASSSSSSSSSPLPLFLYTLQSQCPLSISPNPPLQVDGNHIEEVLSRNQRFGYVSVLFYASWCPFSQSLLPKLEKLSSIFPQVEQLVVEQSSTLPSVFSRYGIHSVPAIFLVNQTSIIRYHGPKDLLSLVQFYERNTGFKPMQYFEEDQQNSLSTDKNSAIKPLISLSPKEICSRQPYLVFSILFLCLRILLYVLPGMVAHLRTFWVSYVPHLNLQIFGETSQVMGRVLQMMDVRRAWTKLRLSKTRSFHQRAKSARVWASSLTSVSLGETSSART